MLFVTSLFVTKLFIMFGRNNKFYYFCIIIK